MVLKSLVQMVVLSLDMSQMMDAMIAMIAMIGMIGMTAKDNIS